MSDDFDVTLCSSTLQQAVKLAKNRVEGLMEAVLAAMPNVASTLNQAMSYASLNGGKRVRPLLIYATGAALGCRLDRLDACAMAVEFIHSYSLVHDDLPAMDDDDLRRGKPTCHIAFDEATAILVGDALQSLAYEIIASDDLAPAVLKSEEKVAMISALAQASGTSGMAAGQALDLEAQGSNGSDMITIESLETIHKNKTGRLIEVCIEMAIIAAAIDDSERFDGHHAEALRVYSRAIGLAFQVRDDILDVTGETAALGKQAGADLILDKATFPAILGLDMAIERCHQLHEAAIDALSIFGEEANLLRAISEYTVSRVH